MARKRKRADEGGAVSKKRLCIGKGHTACAGPSPSALGCGDEEESGRESNGSNREGEAETGEEVDEKALRLSSSEMATDEEEMAAEDPNHHLNPDESVGSVAMAVTRRAAVVQTNAEKGAQGMKVKLGRARARQKQPARVEKAKEVVTQVAQRKRAEARVCPVGRAKAVSSDAVSSGNAEEEDAEPTAKARAKAGKKPQPKKALGRGKAVGKKATAAPQRKRGTRAKEVVDEGAQRKREEAREYLAAMTRRKEAGPSAAEVGSDDDGCGAPADGARDGTHQMQRRRQATRPNYAQQVYISDLDDSDSEDEEEEEEEEEEEGSEGDDSDYDSASGTEYLDAPLPPQPTQKGKGRRARAEAPLAAYDHEKHRIILPPDAYKNSSIRERQINEGKAAATPTVAAPLRMFLELKSHQLNAVRFLWTLIVQPPKEELMGCVIAHTMGLGKTLTSLAFLLLVFQTHRALRKVLVVAPKITVLNWMAEAKHWSRKLGYPLQVRAASGQA